MGRLGEASFIIVTFLLLGPPIGFIPLIPLFLLSAFIEGVPTSEATLLIIKSSYYYGTPWALIFGAYFYFRHDSGVYISSVETLILVLTCSIFGSLILVIFGQTLTGQQDFLTSISEFTSNIAFIVALCSALAVFVCRAILMKLGLLRKP